MSGFLYCVLFLVLVVPYAYFCAHCASAITIIIQTPPMRKKKWPPWLLTVSSRWPKWSQPAVTEPWPGSWLSCDLAVTEPWSYWRCRDWAVTSPWLSCDLAVTELWPRRDWALTSHSHDWAVIIGPRSRDHRGHRELTVSSLWAHGDHLFSHGQRCLLWGDLGGLFYQSSD